MSLDSIALLSKLETDLAHTAAKIYRADPADFNEIAQCFIDKLVRTPAVVRPRTADDVALVVQFCLRNKADFTVRFGGYDCAGRTRVDEALVIDMRDLNEVSISEDKCSATVGGGILHGQLARALGKEELATPV
jgi:FAD/FMN-containing dehydrogenase